jgi:hypothetical protein
MSGRNGSERGSVWGRGRGHLRIDPDPCGWGPDPSARRCSGFPIPAVWTAPRRGVIVWRLVPRGGGPAEWNLRPPTGSWRQEGWTIGTFFLLVAAIVFFGYRLLGEEHRSALRRAARPAVILGGIGFALGFLGPILLTPDANQGPLLGIFITGPGGFALGLLFGIGREVVRRRASLVMVGLLVGGGVGMGVVLSPSPLAAQGARELPRGEAVMYLNEADSIHLTATLFLPPGDAGDRAGPATHPGVVLLSLAGTDPVVDRLTSLGFAVLVPVRRGFVAVEPLLRATYGDLAGDARASLAYLGARPEVDGEALVLMAQADDAPPAILASVELGVEVPLVLLAPPGFPGREVFRLEQRGAAERGGYGPPALEALDRYLEEIADAILGETTPSLRAQRLRAVMAESDVQLPFNAAFPNDQDQVHHLSSPIWHDRFAFQPEEALAEVEAPVLILIGNEDPNTPLLAYLDAVRRGLAAAPSSDATLCLIPGRTRHAFTAVGVDVISDWLTERVGPGAVVGTGAAPSSADLREGCLEDPPRPGGS